MAIFNETMVGGINAKDCTADASKILNGYTAAVGKEIVTGTMPNNGSVNSAIANGVLKEGYTSGGAIANLSEENIIEGIIIAGTKGVAHKLSSYDIVLGTPLASSAIVGCINLNDNTRLAVSSGKKATGIYYSVDGKHWSKVASNGSASCVYIDSYGFAYASDLNVYYSNNSTTWNSYDICKQSGYKVDSGSKIQSLATNNNVLLACLNSNSGMGSSSNELCGLAYSYDNGTTWGYVNYNNVPWTSYDGFSGACWSETLQKWFFVNGGTLYGIEVSISSGGNFSDITEVFDGTNYEYTIRFIKEMEGNVVIGFSDYSGIYIISGNGSRSVITLDSYAVGCFKEGYYYYILTSAGTLYRSTSLKSGYSSYMSVGLTPINAIYGNKLLTIITSTGFFYMYI